MSAVATLLSLGLQLPPPPKVGLLCVGLAGNNGATLVASQLANRRGLTWEHHSAGPQRANYLGCITQIPPLAQDHALAGFDGAAVGGWDVVPTPLGQALYESRVLEYDLVRQLRDELDGVPVMRGVFDADFVGEMSAPPTHVVPPAPRASLLATLRDDIRSFCAREGVAPHRTTVVWSASVERPSEGAYESAAALLAAIDADDAEVSPSILYAAAAALEGCSFVNGGSQNTLSAGLLELASRASPPAYVLGTDFKAGQTKAKTAIVEYLRALGLKPRTIASYNHLGNNDMRNLLSPRTWTAKERVKTDIFGPWQPTDGSAQIDHKVAVLYTPQMGDEKRDTVEYTSEAFMGVEHTMVTYTRCMDSALCVPLMIDAAVFCAHFADRAAPAADAAAALAYLFKLNEGAAEGVDPGFFAQTSALHALLERLPPAPAVATPAAATTSGGGGGRVDGSVLCVGLCCLDMQLLGAESPTTREAIAGFERCDVRAGGSISNTAAALATLGARAAVLGVVGDDGHGAELRRQWAAAGVDASLVVTTTERSTSLAVLPVFAGGGRGCWVDLSANELLDDGAALAAMRAPAAAAALGGCRAIHVGYPHLLARLQGDALRNLLETAPALLGGGGVVRSVDLNGVADSADRSALDVLAPALPLIDLLHANLEEACVLAGVPPLDEDAAVDDDALRALAAPLLARGVAVVAITLAAAGAYIAVTDDDARLEGDGAPPGELPSWAAGPRAHRAAALPLDGRANANGAGDAFCAGLLAGLLWSEPLTLADVVHRGLESARERVDSARAERAAVA